MGVPLAVVVVDGLALGEALAEPLSDVLAEGLGEGLVDADPLSLGEGLSEGPGVVAGGSGVSIVVGNCCGAGASAPAARMPQRVATAKPAMASTATAPHTRPADEVVRGSASSGSAMATG